MAKKKSKRFIIPATFFINTIIEEKLEPVDDEKIELVNEPTHYPISEEEEKEEKKIDQEKIDLPKKQIASPTFNRNRRKSALSISSLKRDKLEEAKFKNKLKAEDKLDDLPKDPFTESDFLNLWKTYIEDLHENGEKIFASILKADIPKIKNNFICLTYPNEMMKAELLKLKSKVLMHLRKELNNYSIDFKITVNEETEKRFAYTPQEKYEFLKAKNKEIVNLRKRFNLEL